MEEIIVKYLSEESSEVENQELLTWVNASESNKRYFTSVCNIWNHTNSKPHSFNSERAHKKFIEFSTSQSKGESFRKPTPRKRNAKSLSLVISGVAASLLIGLFLVFSQKQDVENIIVHNDSQNAKTVTLPDSSIVTLNKLATIEYISQFEGDFREVKLKGEAYFEVAKGIKEFKVITENTTTTVLGTSFDINTEGLNGKTNIYVHAGKVEFEANGNGLKLEAGDFAEFDMKTTTLSKKENGSSNCLSWKTGILVFRNTKLADVFKDIENYYNISVTIETPEILNCKLTAKFDNKPVDEVLESLELLYGLFFEKSNSSISVSGKGC